MTRWTYVVLPAAILAQACGGDDSGGLTPDASHGADTSLDQTSPPDTGGPDTGTPDTGVDTGVDTGTADASDGGCPATWIVAPVVDPSIEVPDGGGGVLLHAAAMGTQNYVCEAVTTDAGAGFAWVFTGPEADLADCASVKIGTHFASDAGYTRPEWATTDGAYVIAKKLKGFIPDGGASAVPWLLLQAVSNGGTSELGKAGYVQRVQTTGGLSPTTGCDATTLATTQKVPYTADYYFFGQ